MIQIYQRPQWHSLTLALSLVLFAGCKEELDSTGRVHTIELQLGSEKTASNSWWKWLIPQAYAGSSNISMCFKRLRFKKYLEDNITLETVEDNIDFDIGDVQIDLAGTYLGAIQLPEGEYHRIEFDLEPGCSYGSIKVANPLYGGAPFSSSQRITIKFDGHFHAFDSGVLTLGTQKIVDALEAYNGTGDLKNAVESVSGLLTH